MSYYIPSNTIMASAMTNVFVAISNTPVSGYVRSTDGACATGLTLQPNQPLLVPECANQTGQFVTISRITRPSSGPGATELMLCRVDITAEADETTAKSSLFDPSTTPCPYTSLSQIPGSWTTSCLTVTSAGATYPSKLDTQRCMLSTLCRTGRVYIGGVLYAAGTMPCTANVDAHCYYYSTLSLKECPPQAGIDNTGGALTCKRQIGKGHGYIPKSLHLVYICIVCPGVCPSLHGCGSYALKCLVMLWRILQCLWTPSAPWWKTSTVTPSLI